MCIRDRYKGDSLGRPILGRASTLEKMTGEWLRQWQQEHYRPQACLLYTSRCV